MPVVVQMLTLLSAVAVAGEVEMDAVVGPCHAAQVLSSNSGWTVSCEEFPRGEQFSGLRPVYADASATVDTSLGLAGAIAGVVAAHNASTSPGPIEFVARSWARRCGAPSS